MKLVERIALVRKHTEQVLKAAGERYGLDMSKVAIRFDLRGRAAGMAGCKRDWHGNTSDHYLRFNVDMINGNGFNHVLTETVPHEVAHIVCYMNPKLGDDHNAGWRNVCIALGGSGDRCHGEEVVYAKGNTYTYITTAGVKVNVSQQRHKKIQAGHCYRFRTGGMINQFCKWSRYVAAAETVAPITELPKIPEVKVTPVAAPVVVATPAPKAVERKPVAKAAGASKADQVRALIREAKATGGDQTAVVTLVVATLGMNKTLARSYVRNNWDKA